MALAADAGDDPVQCGDRAGVLADAGGHDAVLVGAADPVGVGIDDHGHVRLVGQTGGMADAHAHVRLVDQTGEREDAHAGVRPVGQIGEQEDAPRADGDVLEWEGLEKHAADDDVAGGAAVEAVNGEIADCRCGGVLPRRCRCHCEPTLVQFGPSLPETNAPKLRRDVKGSWSLVHCDLAVADVPASGTEPHCHPGKRISLRRVSSVPRAICASHRPR